MVATVREPGRLPGLDALRGLAALGVLIWHYGGHFGATPWGDALRPFYGAGLYLVDVFFVLSGFLLAQLYQCAAAVPEFLFKRACRLFPLHWVTLLAVMGLQRLHEAWTGAPFVYRMNDAFHFGLNVLLVQSSGLQHGFSFNGPAWSISVEWIVNLGFAGVLCVAAWRFRLAMGLALLALAGLGWGQGHLIGEGVLGGVWDAALVRGVFGFFLGVALAGCLPAGGAGRTGLVLGWRGDSGGGGVAVFHVQPRLAGGEGAGFRGGGFGGAAVDRGLLQGERTGPLVSREAFAVAGGGVFFRLSLAFSAADCFCAGAGQGLGAGLWVAGDLAALRGAFLCAGLGELGGSGTPHPGLGAGCMARKKRCGT